MSEVKPIPEMFHDKKGHRLYVLDRGVKSYLILDLDSKYPYKVYEKIIKDSPKGPVEQLKENQGYQGFIKRSDADEHFLKYEQGLCTLLKEED